jgi:hypothetical protein
MGSYKQVSSGSGWGPVAGLLNMVMNLRIASSEVFMTVMFHVEVLWVVTPCGGVV